MLGINQFEYGFTLSHFDMYILINLQSKKMMFYFKAILQYKINYPYYLINFKITDPWNGSLEWKRCLPGLL